MEKGISFALDIFALLMVVLTVILIIIKKKDKQPLFSYVFFAAFAVFLMLLSDMAYVFFAERSDMVTWAFIAKEIYLAANSLVIVAWVNFVGRLIWTERLLKKIFHPVYFTLFGIELAMVVVNAFSNLLFRIAPDGTFAVANVGMIVFTVINYLSVALLWVAIFASRKRLRNGTFSLLIVFQLPTLLCEVLALSFHEISLVCGYAISLILLLNIFDLYTSYKEIDSIIDTALKKDEFQVYYQPIYSVKDKTFTTCEALMRLYHEGKFYAPDKIVQAAEASGAIRTIDCTIFRKVCEFIISDDFKQLKMEYVNVNLSMAHISNSPIVETLLGIMKEYDINPDNICFEITETALATDVESALDSIQLLSNAGVRIALDDFGSGYSNLYRIAMIPFSLIKIDRSIIQNCGIPKFEAIFKSTLQMINSLRLHSVAEGVETEEQLKQCIENGTDYIQGFYYSKPLPQKLLVEFILKQQLTGGKN